MSLFTKAKTNKILNSKAFDTFLDKKLKEHSDAKQKEFDNGIAEMQTKLDTSEEENKKLKEEAELAKLKANEAKVVTDEKGNKFVLNIHKGEKDE